MRRIWDFIQFNNAIPIGLFVLFGGTGAAFAASPAAQQAIYSSQDVVQSVDNTYIVNTDLTAWDFGLQITSVTEDTDNYYVSYTYNTIDVINYVWQKEAITKSFTLAKKELGNQDLGLFVAKQLGQEITQQLAYLNQVQQKERTQGPTLKTVATVYSGLIGKMLNPTQQTFPGYVPVVAEQPDTNSSGAAAVALAGSGATTVATPPPIPSQTDIKTLVDQAVAAALAAQQAAQAGGAATTTPTQPQVGAAPVITINGDNPANIVIGSTYNDLGATVTDDKDNNLGVHTTVNGTPEDAVSIDTSTAAMYTIVYSATDTDGNTTSATRTVVVYDPTPPSGGGGTGTTTPPADTGGGTATTTTTAPTTPTSTTTPPVTTPPAAPPDQSTSTPPADTSTATTTGQ